MDSPRRQASTTVPSTGGEMTPGCCCSCYIFTTLFCIAFPLLFGRSLTLANGKSGCYFEPFTNSVSVVTKPANATTDWRIGLVIKSPVTNCKIKLHAIKSRLFQGDEVISQLSPWVDGFKQATFQETDTQVTSVDFNGVVMMPAGVNKSGVVWDFGVELVAAIKTDIGDCSFNKCIAYLDVNCRDIPVNFTADPARNMVNGLLLGKMRRCNFVFREYLDPFV